MKSVLVAVALVSLVGCAKSAPQPNTPAGMSAKIDAALATSLEYAPDTSDQIDHELANTMAEPPPADFEMPLPEERMPIHPVMFDLASKDDLASPAVKTWGVPAKTDKSEKPSE
jgi:hypothetical protein